MASKSFSFPDMIDKYSGGFKPIEDKEAVKQKSIHWYWNGRIL